MELNKYNWKLCKILNRIIEKSLFRTFYIKLQNADFLSWKTRKYIF